MGLFTPKTAYDRTVKTYPVGARVEIIDPTPDWHTDHPCKFVVAGHVRYRDSDDDPMICVCQVCTAGAKAGWFHPHQIVTLEDL
jgi:hypothetical protein